MTRVLYRSSSGSPARELSARALGWSSIHFGVRRLASGRVWSARAVPEERCLVLLRGSFAITIGRAVHELGPRPDVFDGYPHAVYLPPGAAFRLAAVGACEFADCRVRVGRHAASGLEPRVIRPEDCGYEVRGGGNATRQIVDILPPAFPAARLMICEVFTPSGNWSSYPPHKHDAHNPPREADLDEIYYYRFRNGDAAAYGIQNLYTSRREQTIRVKHGDVIAVREGYHPFVTAYGYDAYYLNVLAGTCRSMAATDDPRYEQFRRTWPAPDPRVPVVPPPGHIHHLEEGVS